MPKVFLSHSSFDKVFVRRIRDILHSHEIQTWLDEQNMRPGQRISEEIQKGISDSDFFLLFLSPRAMESGWVQREWQSRLHREVKENQGRLIPLVIQDCELPEFLKDIVYIDFRKDFEEGISLLLTSIAAKSENTFDFSSVSTAVNGMLEDLEDEAVVLPYAGRIFVIKTLKRLPRSGKHLRLGRQRQIDGSDVPSRSIYDHIISLAHSADVLYPHLDHRLVGAEVGDLARCIAYHELNEILLGDIPSFTNITSTRRQKSRIQSEQRLRSVDPREREYYAHKFIWMFLDIKHRASLDRFMDLAEEKSAASYNFFQVLDKMDPIIGVWRYLDVFRGQLEQNGARFIRAMADFFSNPDPSKIVQSYGDEQILTLLSFLQDASNAQAFYRDSEFLLHNEDWLGFSPEVRNKLIRGRGMHFMEVKGRT